MIEPNKEDFDDMHHALGRPSKDYQPEWETYRNHYCAALDGHTSKRFKELGWWIEGGTINHGHDMVWHVNEAGRQALARHLKA